MFGKTPGHGRRVFCEHLGKWLRSSWELTIAQAMLSLNIAHTYESHRLDLGDCTYLPDFYLPDLDIFIEVKGWENLRFATVLPKLREQRPDVRLLVIRQAEYDLIRRDAAHLKALLDTV